MGRDASCVYRNRLQLGLYVCETRRLRIVRLDQSVAKHGSLLGCGEQGFRADERTKGFMNDPLTLLTHR